MLKEINKLERDMIHACFSPYSKLKGIYDVTLEDLDDYDTRCALILSASTLPPFEEIDQKEDIEDVSTMFLSVLAFCKEWEEMRRTFIINEDFADVLTDAKDTKMYLKVFENIKYPCFAFEPDLKANIMENANLVGFVVDIQNCEITKEDVDNVIKDGHKPKKAGKYFGFSLMSVFEEEEDDVNLAMPFSFMLNYDDLKEDEYGKYFSLDDIWIPSGHLVSPARLTLSLRLAYYLCSKEPDIVENKAVIAQKKKIDKITNPKLKKKKMKEFEYKSEVGTRIGNAIRLNATKETQAESKGKSNASNKTRKMVTPHVRGAHWSHRWHGSKDNKELQPCFIAPTFVNPHLGEIDEVKQVIKV